MAYHLDHVVSGHASVSLRRPCEVRDAGTHIVQVVAVHVDEHTATGTLDEDRQPYSDPGGDRLGLLGQQPLGTRTGNLGDQPALLGDLGVHQGRVHASSTQR